MTLVELLSAMVIAGVLLSVSVSGIHGAVGNNAARMEANRLLMDIQMARSEAIKRGENVYMCIADADDCDPLDLGTCRCKVGVPAKNYSQGWLVFVDSDGDQDFDDATEQLLFVGEPPADQITLKSNNLIQFGLGLTPSGSFQGQGNEGELGVCFDDESTAEVPGRMLIVKVTGRTQIKQMAPGDSCTPDPGNSCGQGSSQNGSNNCSNDT